MVVVLNPFFILLQNRKKRLENSSVHTLSLFKVPFPRIPDYSTNTFRAHDLNVIPFDLLWSLCPHVISFRHWNTDQRVGDHLEKLRLDSSCIVHHNLNTGLPTWWRHHLIYFKSTKGSSKHSLVGVKSDHQLVFQCYSMLQTVCNTQHVSKCVSKSSCVGFRLKVQS